MNVDSLIVIGFCSLSVVAIYDQTQILLHDLIILNFIKGMAHAEHDRTYLITGYFCNHEISVNSVKKSRNAQIKFADI